LDWIYMAVLKKTVKKVQCLKRKGISLPDEGPYTSFCRNMLSQFKLAVMALNSISIFIPSRPEGNILRLSN
jgi:hypothetical protein